MEEPRISPSAIGQPKIDIHCHTTNRKVPDVAPESATLEAISQEMDKHGVKKTVLLATYFPHRTSGISNFRLLHWISRGQKRTGRRAFLLFGSLDFEHYFFQGINELEELADSKKISGIKIYTCYQNIDVQGEKIRKVASLAYSHKLPMMFHCGYAHGRSDVGKEIAITDSVKPKDLEWIADEYPGMSIIISHLADPSTDNLIEVVNRHETVYADMSGLINSNSRFNDSPGFFERVKAMSVEQINRYVNSCGPKKLLFGTDFPIQTHSDSVELVEAGMKGFSDSDKSLVYVHNAAGLLGIPMATQLAQKGELGERSDSCQQKSDMRFSDAGTDGEFGI